MNSQRYYCVSACVHICCVQHCAHPTLCLKAVGSKALLHIKNTLARYPGSKALLYIKNILDVYPGSKVLLYIKNIHVLDEHPVTCLAYHRKQVSSSNFYEWEVHVSYQNMSLLVCRITLPVYISSFQPLQQYCGKGLKTRVLLVISGSTLFCVVYM